MAWCSSSPGCAAISEDARVRRSLRDSTASLPMVTLIISPSWRFLVANSASTFSRCTASSPASFLAKQVLLVQISLTPDMV